MPFKPLKMIIFRTIKPLQNRLGRSTEKISFVPTMGALHDGHISLLKMAPKDTIRVCSIFVNPTQFNDPSDYQHYPVTIEKDIEKLTEAGVDILFLPSVEEMYPEGPTHKEHYDLGDLESVFEGEFRPGHYQGVCQVVDKLLSIVRPDTLFMGQKDYQQCMVIRRLLELKKHPTELVMGPTLRETDGLAMSSRNVRLTPDERQQAVSIWKTLQWFRENLGKYSPADLGKQASEKLLSNGFHKVDYFTLADARNLTPLKEWTPDTESVILCAAFLGQVRLIDNLFP